MIEWIDYRAKVSIVVVIRQYLNSVISHMLSVFLAHLNTGDPKPSATGIWRLLSEANQAVLGRDLGRAEALLDDLGAEHDDEVSIAVGLVRSRLLTLRGERDAARQQLESVKDAVWTLGSDARAAWLHRYGVILRLDADLDEAMRCQLAARDTYVVLGRKLDAALCSVEIGSILLGRGDVGSATREYLGVIDDIQQFGTALQLAGVKGNLAVAMQRAGDRTGAARVYEELLMLPPFNVQSSERAVVLQNLAVIRKLDGSYDVAIERYAEALQCLDPAAHSERIIRIKCGIGDLSLRLHDVQAVRSVVDELATVDIDAIQPSTAIELLSLRYRIAILDGQPDQARECITGAQSIATDNGLVEEQAELLRDALSVISDDTERLPLVEELARIQTDRLHAVSTTISTMVELRSKYEQERAAQELARQQERTQVILETQERTMEEIGRDLHDSIGNDLALALRWIDRLQQRGDVTNEDLTNLVAEIRTSVQQASEDARRISHLMAAPGLDGSTLGAAVSDLLHAAQEALPDVSFSLAVRGDLEPVSTSYAKTVYRCLQTLLQNVMRHADATAVEVQVTSHADELICSVEDNGKGFDPNVVVRGLGLRSVIARVAAHGGTVAVDSTPGRGAFVSLHLPLGHTRREHGGTDQDLSAG